MILRARLAALFCQAAAFFFIKDVINTEFLV